MLIACDITGETTEAKINADGSPRLPSGWKRHRGQVYSKDAWKSAFTVRTLTVPVCFPADKNERDRVMDLLHRAWADVTTCRNYFMDQFRKRDITRTPDMEKLPKIDAEAMKVPAAEAHADLGDLVLSGSTFDTCKQLTWKDYMADRYETIWLRKKQFRSYRYPQPLPVREKEWKLEERDGDFYLSIVIGGERVELKLRRGPHFRYQGALLKAICRQEVKAGDCKILRATPICGVRARAGGRRAARRHCARPRFAARAQARHHATHEVLAA